jgi:hypothetical protein
MPGGDMRPWRNSTPAATSRESGSSMAASPLSPPAASARAAARHRPAASRPRETPRRRAPQARHRRTASGTPGSRRNRGSPRARRSARVPPARQGPRAPWRRARSAHARIPVPRCASGRRGRRSRSCASRPAHRLATRESGARLRTPRAGGRLWRR